MTKEKSIIDIAEECTSVAPSGDWSQRRPASESAEAVPRAAEPHGQEAGYCSVLPCCCGRCYIQQNFATQEAMDAAGAPDRSTGKIVRFDYDRATCVLDGLERLARALEGTGVELLILEGGCGYEEVLVRKQSAAVIAADRPSRAG